MIRSCNEKAWRIFFVITEICQLVSEQIISRGGVFYQKSHLISCFFAELGDDLFRLIYGGFIHAYSADTLVA